MTYHNEENGFCVLRVKARGQRDLITIVDHGRRLSDSLGVTAIRWIHKT